MRDGSLRRFMTSALLLNRAPDAIPDPAQIVQQTHAGRCDGEQTLSLPASLGRRLAHRRSHEALLLEPFERGIYRAHDHIATGGGRDESLHRHGIRGRLDGANGQITSGGPEA